MCDEAQKLIDGVRSRKTSTRWGIGLASEYLKSIVPCFEGGALCPTDAFGVASKDAWVTALKDAESRLVYCDPDSAITVVSSDSPQLIVKAMRTDGEGRAAKTLLEYDTILLTDSKDRDGDILEPKGAILDPSMPLLWQHIPMQPIGKMVGLVAHGKDSITIRNAIADVPLGKDAATLVEFGALRTSHGFKPYKFEPVSAKQFDEEGRPNGFRVKSFDVMECSLVSVPANVEAVITAFSRNKLTTPLIKSWAKHYFDARPTIVPGHSFEDGGEKGSEKGKAKPRKPGMCPKCGSTMEKGCCTKCSYEEKTEPDEMNSGKAIVLDAAAYKALNSAIGISPAELASMSMQQVGYLIEATKRGRRLSQATRDKINAAVEAAKVANDKLSELVAEADAAETSEEKAAGLPSDKSAGMEVGGIKSMLELSKKYIVGESSPYLKGSFEYTAHALQRSAADHIRGKGISLGRDTYAYMVATFPGDAVVCCYTYSDSNGSQQKCYRMDYEVDSGGKVSWSGDPKEVEIEATIVEKLVRDVRMKSGDISPAAMAERMIARTLEMETKESIAALEKSQAAVGEYLAVLKRQAEVEEWRELEKTL